MSLSKQRTKQSIIVDNHINKTIKDLKNINRRNSIFRKSIEILKRTWTFLESYKKSTKAKHSNLRILESQVLNRPAISNTISIK